MLADVDERTVLAEAEILVAAAHRADVGDDADVAAMVDRTVAKFNRLDAAFNNAEVISRITPVAESTRGQPPKQET